MRWASSRPIASPSPKPACPAVSVPRLKALEDRLALLGIDAWPLVADRDPRPAP